MDTLETYQALLVAKRKVFLNSIMNQTSDLLPATLDTMLAEYEAVVEVISTVVTWNPYIYISTLYIYGQVAADNGINIVSQEYSVSWDYSQAIFFVITILTTIGYGDIKQYFQKYLNFQRLFWITVLIFRPLRPCDDPRAAVLHPVRHRGHPLHPLRDRGHGPGEL